MPTPATARPASMPARPVALALSAGPSSSGSAVSRNAFLRGRPAASQSVRQQMARCEVQWKALSTLHARPAPGTKRKHKAAGVCSGFRHEKPSEHTCM